MPFTHDRPLAGRHIATAFSVMTDGIRTTSRVISEHAFTSDEDRSRFTGLTSYLSAGGVDVETIYSQYSSQQGDGETTTYNANATRTERGETYVEDRITPTYTGANWTQINLETSQDGETTGAFSTSDTRSRSKNNSFKSTGGGGGQTIHANQGFGSSEFATIYTAGESIGVRQTIFNTTASGSSISKRGGTHADSTRTTSFSDGTVSTRTISRRGGQFIYQVKTSPSMTTRSGRSVVTYRTSISTIYPIGSGSTKITTTKSSYETSTREYSFQDYVTGTIRAPDRPISTYLASSIHGGAFWATGGTRLSNDFVVGAQSATAMTNEIGSQLDLDEEFVFNAYYEGDAETFTITDIVNVTTESQSQYLTSVSVQFTKMGFSLEEVNDFVDFDTVRSQANVFDTFTYSERFSAPATTDASGYTTEESTDEIAGVTTFQCDSIVSSSTGSFNQTYVAESGLAEIGGSYITTNLGTGTTQFGLTQKTNTATIGKVKTISRATPLELLRTTAFGIGQKYATRNIITYDKGNQGGVQYKTSNNISGAMRSPRNVSIAHAYITTTNTTSRNSIGSTTSAINVTINSSITGSYLSKNLPLSFSPQLNRYAPFLPAGNYGDIYYLAPGAYVYLSNSADGSSIIKCIKEFAYNTANGNSRATTTIDTVLFGLLKVEQGGNDANYKKTKLYAGGANSFGGGVFTNRKGAVINVNAPPATYYAFGTNGSTAVAQNLTGIGDGYNFVTKELPANAMIFMREDVQAYAGSGEAVFYRS